MPLSFRCPACFAPLAAAARLAGQTIRCHRCRAPVMVPGALQPGTELHQPEIEEPEEVIRRVPRWAWWCAGGGGLLLLVLVAAILAASQSSKEAEAESRFKGIPSDRLRDEYETNRDAFHATLEMEKEARAQGRSIQADKLHEEARKYFQEMKAIEKELRSRGQW